MQTAASQSHFARRLPSLPSVATISDDHAAALSAANPSRVLTATSRYRNDPYRVPVVIAPDAGDHAHYHVGEEPHLYNHHHEQPQPSQYPPAGTTGMDKLAPAPRRGQLPLRGSQLPALSHTSNTRTRSQRSTNGSTRRTPTPPPQPVPATRVHEKATAAAAEKPTATTAGGGASKIALIQFKRTMMSALYDSSALSDLAVDDRIIVEGDRGEHIATVCRVNVKKSKSTPTLIVRRATAEDLEQHERVKEAEAVALDTCRAHAQRLGLAAAMSVEDVEFQLDFQKLTVFFAARDPTVFVDFRSLQRALYQHFRCRIWIADV